MCCFIALAYVSPLPSPRLSHIPHHTTCYTYLDSSCKNASRGISFCPGTAGLHGQMSSCLHCAFFHSSTSKITGCAKSSWHRGYLECREREREREREGREREKRRERKKNREKREQREEDERPCMHVDEDAGVSVCGIRRRGECRTRV